jgi:hypothetical protein
MPERITVKQCEDHLHYYLTNYNGYFICVFCRKLEMREVKQDDNGEYYYDTYSNVEKNEHVDPTTQRVIVTNCTDRVNDRDRGSNGIHYQHYYTQKVSESRNRCVFCEKLREQAEMKQVNEFKNDATSESYYYYDNSTTKQHGQKTEQHEQKTEQHEQKYMKYKNKYLNLKKLSQL